MPFAKLQLMEPLRKALAQEGYTVPTPIQQQAIPPLLEGKDLMGIAQTGTGKTAAFVLPILQRMSEQHRPLLPGAPHALVLAPTRELAAQIDQSFATYGRFLQFSHTVIFGGVGQGPQVRALSHGVDVLVATPGRLLDLIEQRYVKLSDVEYLVLDEADRMLDMGFINDVRKIVGMLPRKRQSLFFSATMSAEVSNLAKTMLTNPVRVEVAPQATTVERVVQKVLFVDGNKKDPLLLELVRQEHLRCVLVFTRTKHRANRVALMLTKNGVEADAIHGNKSQAQRTRALEDFRSGKVQVLVATDIAARGIDIDGISHVINYDLPNEPESYVHRIGRTARAGADGTAYSFCAADERGYLRDIVKLTGTEIESMEHRYHSPEAERSTSMGGRQAKRKQWMRHKKFGPGRDRPRRYHRRF